jgi:2-octaprenyl-6-methoxyphenol hydroxylase
MPEAQMLDVLVAGGGYVGLSLAVAVKKAAPHLAVEVVDGAPDHAWRKDERAFAIVAAARNLLDVLGIWNGIEPEAEPIRRMVITDSRTADPVRPVFLTFEGAGSGDDGQPFAHMVPNRAITAGLLKQAEALGVTIRWSTSVEGFSTGQHATTVSLSDGTERHTRLLVACDGVRSKLRDMAGIKVVTMPDWP